jgi:hypothetical protein
VLHNLSSSPSIIIRMVESRSKGRVTRVPRMRTKINANKILDKKLKT